MNPSVIDGLMRQSDIDGVLVGGASLDAATFGQIASFHTGWWRTRSFLKKVGNAQQQRPIHEPLPEPSTSAHDSIGFDAVDAPAGLPDFYLVIERRLLIGVPSELACLSMIPRRGGHQRPRERLRVPVAEEPGDQRVHAQPAGRELLRLYDRRIRPGQLVRPDDVVAGRSDDGVLVGLGYLRFVRRQEARPHARAGVAQLDGSSQVSSIGHGARLGSGAGRCLAILRRTSPLIYCLSGRPSHRSDISDRPHHLQRPSPPPLGYERRDKS